MCFKWRRRRFRLVAIVYSKTQFILEDITVIKENDSDSEPQKTDIDYEMKRQKQINRRGE